MSPSDGNTAPEWVPTGSVTVRVPGKVNLFLGVGDRRPDGYHELTTVFHAVSLVDEVTVRHADVLSLRTVGEGAEELPDDERNLAWQAAVLMAEHVGRGPDVEITIEKSIPVAGGMAGGSADAAAVLRACSLLWDVAEEEVQSVAAEIGSDVPFALMGGTAIGRGRGTELTPVLTTGEYHWVLAVAREGLSTPRVYQRCDDLRGPDVEAPGISDSVLAALRQGDAETLGALLSNDLQDAAISLRPELAQVLDAGREAGASGAIVSGSGPTCAFLVPDPDIALEVGVSLSASGLVGGVRQATGPAPGATVVAVAEPPQGP